LTLKRCNDEDKVNGIIEMRTNGAVEYSPEKAGVGGSTPSLATI
jgi:hypothetical protein